MEIIKISYQGGKPARPKKLRVSQKFAELALKKNNVANGGYYMAVSDLRKYFLVEEKSVTQKVEEKAAAQEAVKPAAQEDTEPQPTKRRRKAKSIEE
jgi:hypothetical protein